MLSFIMETVTNDKRSQQMAAVQKEAFELFLKKNKDLSSCAEYICASNSKEAIIIY